MSEDDLRSELLETYNRFYIEGFKTNNIELIGHIVRYPITYVRDGMVSAMDRYPVDCNPPEKPLD